ARARRPDLLGGLRQREVHRDGARCTDGVWEACPTLVQVKPLVMGVVNVTPDSFSDGGAFADHAAAIAHGLRLAEEGADWIDVGGESTRPGATPVPEAEELRRVLPVVEALAGEGLAVSIDTRKEAVARAAVAAGATLLNDVGARLG